MSVTELLRSRIVDVPDFPVEGVVFKDISPLLADHAAFVAAVDAVVAAHEDAGTTKVVGIEARGFLLAAPAAYHLGAGFVPVRKPGKLPGPTRATSYDLEYGSNVLQVHRDAFAPGDRVLVVDDVLATGGTAAATVRLLERLGAKVVGLGFVIELGFLNGRRQLPERDILSLLHYE
jgi:adenine phosphoribosyltransferase